MFVHFLYNRDLKSKFQFKTLKLNFATYVFAKGRKFSNMVITQEGLYMRINPLIGFVKSQQNLQADMHSVQDGV